MEEEDPYLNYKELKNAIYEESAYPTSVEHSSNIEGYFKCKQFDNL